MCFPFYFLFEILKGVFYGCNWHYSPSNRAEVAKYGERASVGPQQCRVSSQDEKRKRVGYYGPLFISTNHVLGIETLSSERSKFFASKGHFWRIEVLVIITLKGNWLWCCVYHLLLGKSTFFHVRFNVKPIVQFWDGSECCFGLHVLIVCLLVSFVISTTTMMSFRSWDGYLNCVSFKFMLGVCSLRMLSYVLM